MAPASMSSTKLMLFLALFSTTIALPAESFDFEVGDHVGWEVPPSNNTQFYNQWASRNRFQVGDTINFRYKKDSVMEVSEEEYKQCNSSQPFFFSNNGRTELRLDRSGTFYFISGVWGHCERGQRMVIKVMGHSKVPGGSPGSNHTDSSNTPDSSVAPAPAQFGMLLFTIASLFACSS